MDSDELVDLSAKEVSEIFKDLPLEQIKAIKRKRKRLRNRKHAGKIKVKVTVLSLKNEFLRKFQK